jgi:hypothetical protein
VLSDSERPTVPDVFISYSKVDRHIAEALADDLRDHGVRVWWDYQLYAGDDFHDAILDALDACTVAIVIWSASAVRSRWVKDEANRAADGGKLITTHVPGFDLAKIPLGHGTTQSVDVTMRTRVYEAIARRGISIVTPPRRSAAKREPKLKRMKPLPAAYSSIETIDFRDLVDIRALGDAVDRSNAEALLRSGGDQEPRDRQSTRPLSGACGLAQAFDPAAPAPTPRPQVAVPSGQPGNVRRNPNGR